MISSVILPENFVILTRNDRIPQHSSFCHSGNTHLFPMCCDRFPECRNFFGVILSFCKNIKLFQPITQSGRLSENPPLLRNGMGGATLALAHPSHIRPALFFSVPTTANLKGVRMSKTKVVHTIDFIKSPKIGTVLLLEGQRYEVVGLLVHTRRDGSPTMLILWQGFCADCGMKFTFKTGMQAKSVNRRCDNHKRPGKAVSADGRRRQRLFIKNNRRKSS